ncbi:hypothetical protein BH09ACT4_BH09ACT4_17240 [soil metagenome]
MTVPAPQQPAGYWSPNVVPRMGTVPGRAPTNVWAWTGLIVSVSGFIFNLGVNGLLGAAFSVIGLREAKRLEAAGFADTGRSIAFAGLVTGIVHVIVTIALVVLAVLAWAWFAQWIDTVTTELQNSNLSGSS